VAFDFKEFVYQEENPHLKDSIANCMDRIYLRFISLDMKYTEADFNWVLSKEIPVLLESHNVRLVVIDSIAAVYRQTFAFDKLGDRSLALFQIASYLKRISDENGCPVVVTNQVSDDFKSLENMSGSRYARAYGRLSKGRTVVPALGFSWSSCVNTRIMLTRSLSFNPDIPRYMHLIFSPAQKSGKVSFSISKIGIRNMLMTETQPLKTVECCPEGNSDQQRNFKSSK